MKKRIIVLIISILAITATTCMTGLFRDISNELRERSKEWEWIVDNLFKPKCEELGYCTERKSCGRKEKK